MDRVLVGVDGSAPSRAALSWGARFARRLDLPVQVVQAWQYPSDAILTIGKIRLPEPEDADASVLAGLKVLVDEVVDVEVETTFDAHRGPPAGALLHVASYGEPFIVVGSRGLGGFQGLRQGSVSRQVCEHAHAPVTVIRDATVVEPFRLETIMVGTDGSPEASQAMRFAADLATAVDADLIVAHVVPPAAAMNPKDIEEYEHLGSQRQAVEAWCQPLTDRGQPHQVALVEGDARAGLLDLASDWTADLLVVGSRGRGPLASLLLGSVAASLAQHTTVPLTIVPTGTGG